MITNNTRSNLHLLTHKRYFLKTVDIILTNMYNIVFNKIKK